MSSTRELRKAPPRRFENYILTRSTAASISLSSVPDSLFTPCSPGAIEVFGQDPGVGFTDDGLSTPINIGFDFEIDNITYKQFVACTNGWMALVDPTLGTFDSTDVLDANIWVNSGIKHNFTTNAVLLAPWFDDLRNVAEDPIQANSTYGATKISRIRQGLEATPNVVNSVQFGVKFFFDPRSSRGRRLIVRWNSLSDFSSPNTVIRFEVIIYENGTIEYRYSPRQNINISLSANSPEDATIGIFMPNGTDRFRDFSYGLGYRDTERQQYHFGGAVITSSYVDVSDFFTSSYTSNLKPFIHWPGLDSAGGMFTFMPPKNKRRVLPRAESARAASRLTLPTVARTGDSRRGNDPIIFDDRRSTPFTDVLSGTGGLVNYPTTLQRFFGDSEPNIVGRQDLFAGDFELTASVIKAVVDQFIIDDLPRSIEPFSEYKLFENDPMAAADPFFASGSSIDALGDGLQQSLRAKTQIRFSLPVNFSTVLFGTSSTIHYYNKRLGTWNVPANSSYTITSLASTNDSGKPKGDIISDLTVDSVAGRVNEDHRGFGPIGNRVSSGSHNRTATGDQSDASINGQYSALNVTLALSKAYAKSVTNNEEYKATPDEVFALPINQPFLIERAIIELPFAAGDGWFSDRTTCLATMESQNVSGFDFGGPGLTVSLFNQTINGSLSRRDLIMTGTLTHASDNVAELVCSAFPPLSSTFQIRPRGFLAFGAVPGAVVAPVSTSSGLTFTGSVAVRCEAQVSNGVVARLELTMTSSNIQNNKSGVIDVFNTSQITLENQVTNHYSQSCNIAYIDNLGRGSTGFDPSGRSIFGKEFGAPVAVNKQGKVLNPFYLAATNGGAASPTFVGIPPQFAESITVGNTFRFEAALPLLSCKPSPYLVIPGDTLVLSISKTRPVSLGSHAPSPTTSGSIQHDVQLITGSINIVLYGSMIREGREFHDTLNQPLASDAIHEIVIGNEPILDQFESDYRDSYSSGSYDDFIDGNMITKVNKPNGQIAFVTGSVIGSATAASILSRGSRGRIFGKNDARNAPVPGTSDFDFTDSQAFRSQPYYEKAGTPRVHQLTDNTERFWDSLMPALNQCFLADGAGIFLLRRDPNDFSNTNYIGDPRRVDQRLGFLWFDYQAPSWFPTWGSLLDGVWTWSFPFEPRYSTIPRQQFIERSFLANYSVDFAAGFGTAAPVQSIDPVPLQGFFFGPVGTEIPSVPPKQSTNAAGPFSNNAAFDFNWVCDSRLNSTTPQGFILTGSAGASDAIKALFGFGDMNNRVYTTLGTFGTTHFADFRRREPDPSYNFGSKWSMSPIIRGWKYGVYSGLPAFSKAYFRAKRYGQFRDMLEQRPFTKFYLTPGNDPRAQGPTPAAVTVKFVDAGGKLTNPQNTLSQNLSFEATSSMPYFDGETRNRPPINTNTLNSNIIALNANQFGQVTL